MATVSTTITGNIELSELRSCYNNVNSNPDISTNVSLSKFRGVDLEVAVFGYTNFTTSVYQNVSSAANTILTNKKITFTYVSNSTAYNIDYGNSTTWETSVTSSFGSFSDDSYRAHTFTNSNTFTFYGISYSTMYVGSNGYITFGSGTNDYSASLSEFQSRKLLSFFWRDLNPTYSPLGSILYKYINSNTILITQFTNIAQYGSTGTRNYIEIRMYMNNHSTSPGKIEFNYGSIQSSNAYVGISKGNGTASVITYTNSSTYQSNQLTNYTIPSSGAISIKDHFAGKTFKNMTPNMTITSSDVNNSGLSGLTTLSFTFTSSQPTSNFVLSDITVSGGALSALSGTGTTYTSTFTSTGYGSKTIDVPQGVYTNNKNTIGSLNNASPQFAWSHSAGNDIRTQFYEISSSFINSQVYMGNSADYNGNYDVGEVVQGYTSPSGSTVRIYLGHKVTVSLNNYTFYNDTPVAAVVHLNSSNTIVNNNKWIFSTSGGGSGNGWQTINSQKYGDSSVGPGTSSARITPSIASGYSYQSITTSANSARWSWATGTGSAYTGAADGINGTTPSFPVGLKTVPQSYNTHYAYRECSGSTLWSTVFMRSPPITINSGDKIRVVHALTGPTNYAADPDDSLWIGIW